MKKPSQNSRKLVFMLLICLSMLLILVAIGIFILSTILQSSTFRADLQKPNRYTELRYLNYMTNEMYFDVVYNQKEHDDVFLYFHGNIGRLNYILEYLNKHTTFMAIAYSGYHRSSGKASVDGSLAAVDALVNIVNKKFANTNVGKKDIRLHLIGHSLGSQTATYFANLLKDDPRLRTVSIVAGFPSVQYLCENTMGTLKIICFVAKDSFNATHYLSKFGENDLSSKTMVPNFFIYHLPDDATIPYQAGKDLYLSLQIFLNGKNILFTDFTSGTHGEFDIELVVKNALSLNN